KEKEWLLLKKADAFVGDDEPTERAPESVLSGLTVEELYEGPARLAQLRSRLEALKVPRGALSLRPPPLMLASAGDHPFSGKEWLFEIKYDGVRVLASRTDGSVELYGRNGQVVTGRYPEIARALLALPVEGFVLDGELVALDEGGRPSFQRLQARMHLTNPLDIERARTTVPVTGIFFDCLALEGRDLRRLPLRERKRCLGLLVPARGVIRYGDHILEHGEAFFEAASEQQLEGIVAKKVESRYLRGRSREWIKLKCQRRQEFVIGGYTDPKGSRSDFGALHVGLYEGGKLAYVAKVGTGFDQRGLKSIWARLESLGRPTSPFEAGGPTGRGHHWVEPRLVCEVRFTEWTRDGGIRHPAYLGLRGDKAPEECLREPLPAEALSPSPPLERLPQVKVTNPTKVFWPDEGYTKADLIAYYDAVAPLLLPYLRDRPLVLTRYPDGIAGKSFFQKDAPEFVPSWVRTERIYSKDTGREIDYFIVNDAETLRYVVNLGTIPLHLWSSRLGSLDRPDWLVLDLDPKDAPFADVVRVARRLRRILEELELPSSIKTSGATGLHLLLPLRARYSHEEARTFARLLALLGVQAEPERATVSRPIRARGGKVYIDFGQNGHGRTIVAPFSVRPLRGAPVSCPLRWEEVTTRLNPEHFTIKTAPARFKGRADPLAPILASAIDMARALARIERKLGKRSARS
ncbi:MAG: DNA ligase D, partial [Candidatus Methylomirabilia bacterium]